MADDTRSLLLEARYFLYMQGRRDLAGRIDVAIASAENSEHQIEYRVVWEWHEGDPDFKVCSSAERAAQVVEEMATDDPDGRLNARIQMRTVSEWIDR